MFTISLVLFATVLLLLYTAAARGMRHIDEILEIVDTREGAKEAPQAALPAES